MQVPTKVINNLAAQVTDLLASVQESLVSDPKVLNHDRVDPGQRGGSRERGGDRGERGSYQGGDRTDEE